MVHWKYLLRPLTKRMRPERLHAFVAWYVPKLIPVARALNRIAGAAGRRLVPILDQTDKAVSHVIQREWPCWTPTMRCPLFTTGLKLMRPCSAGSRIAVLPGFRCAMALDAEFSLASDERSGILR